MHSKQTNPGKQAHAHEQEPVPDIDALKRRHRELENQKIAAETNLDRATEELDRLRNEAREQYGTDDLEDLRQKLEEMKSDNERKRYDYDRHLAQIETELGRIENDRPEAPRP